MIINLPIPAESNVYKRTHQHLLRREVERAARDPFSYQSEHECSLRVIGAIVDGPVAETRVEKQISNNRFVGFTHSLEPPGFPAL